jgi:hypothetical protein
MCKQGWCAPWRLGLRCVLDNIMGTLQPVFRWTGGSIDLFPSISSAEQLAQACALT